MEDHGSMRLPPTKNQFTLRIIDLGMSKSDVLFSIALNLDLLSKSS